MGESRNLKTSANSTLVAICLSNCRIARNADASAQWVPGSTPNRFIFQLFQFFFGMFLLWGCGDTFLNFVGRVGKENFTELHILVFKSKPTFFIFLYINKILNPFLTFVMRGCMKNNHNKVFCFSAIVFTLICFHNVLDKKKYTRRIDYIKNP